MISKDEEVNFDFSYSAVGGNPEKKKMNKFLSELVLHRSSASECCHKFFKLQCDFLSEQLKAPVSKLLVTV